MEIIISKCLKSVVKHRRANICQILVVNVLYLITLYLPMWTVLKLVQSESGSIYWKIPTPLRILADVIWGENMIRGKRKWGEM